MQASELSSPGVPPVHVPASVPAWHLAIRAQFFVLGLLMGAWGAQVPAVKRHYGLDEATLSYALLAAAGGAVFCLFVAGSLVARFGVRHCVQVGALLLAGSLAVVLQLHSYALLMLLMLALGAGSALFDVAINSEGNTLETQGRRKVMSGLHAMFSLGGMSGALLCAGLHRVAAQAPLQLLGISLAVALPVFWAAGRLSSLRTHAEPLALSWPRGLLLWMGLLTTLGMVAEGAMYDWSALFVRQELHTDEATGALAFAAFSAAMAGGRLVGDWVRGHVAPIPLLRRSGALAAIGMALALLVGEPWAALLGFVLVGLGLSNVIPVVFAAAGQVPGIPAAAGVAAVSSVGYMGFMIGPPLIGLLARWTTLSAALWTVALFAALMGLAARAVLGRRS